MTHLKAIQCKAWWVLGLGIGWISLAVSAHPIPVFPPQAWDLQPLALPPSDSSAEPGDSVVVSDNMPVWGTPQEPDWQQARWDAWLEADREVLAADAAVDPRSLLVESPAEKRAENPISHGTAFGEGVPPGAQEPPPIVHLATEVRATAGDPPISRISYGLMKPWKWIAEWGGLGIVAVYIAYRFSRHKKQPRSGQLHTSAAQTPQKSWAEEDQAAAGSQVSHAAPFTEAVWRGMDPQWAQLDLIRLYIRMGEYAQAYALLDPLLASPNPQIQEQAQKLAAGSVPIGKGV